MITTSDFIQFQSKSGLPIRVRSLRGEDAPLLIDIFEHMGPDSRYTRFHQPLDDPSPALVWRGAQQLAQIDPKRDAAYIAFADLPGEPDAPVAVVRYGYLSPDEAEMAVTVRDDLRGSGIGAQMSRILIEHARQAGIKRLVGLVQRSNTPMFQVFQKLGYPIGKKSEGTAVEVTIYLEGAPEEDPVADGDTTVD